MPPLRTETDATSPKKKRPRSVDFMAWVGKSHGRRVSGGSKSASKKSDSEVKESNDDGGDGGDIGDIEAESSTKQCDESKEGEEGNDGKNPPPETKDTKNTAKDKNADEKKDRTSDKMEMGTRPGGRSRTRGSLPYIMPLTEEMRRRLRFSRF